MKIECRNLTKKIRWAVVLDDISLTLEGGRIYGLWGKNGCGKTMLMRALCGLIRPTSGHIFYGEKELGKDFDFPPSIGLLLENPAFLNSYTGFQNLKALADIKGMTEEEQIREVMNEVGLDPEDRRTVRQYSLGMKQRLGIANALMEKPELLLLDEPLNAIDEKGAEKMKELICRMKDENRIILVACHDREDLSSMADTVIFMEEGKIKDVTAVFA